MREIIAVAKQQFQRMIVDWKFWLASMLGVMLSIKVLWNLIDYYKAITSATNIFEPYIYLGSNRVGFLSVFLGSLFLLADAPFKSDADILEIIRIGKRKWMLGRLLFMLAACFLYTFFVFIGTTVLFAIKWHVYFDNLWSPGFLFLAQEQPFFATEKFGITFPFNTMVQDASPIIAFIMTIACNSMYSFIIGLIIFVINVLSGKNVGWVVAAASHVISYVLLVGGAFFAVSIPFSPLTWAMPGYALEKHTMVSSTVVAICVIYFFVDICISVMPNKEI